MQRLFFSTIKANLITKNLSFPKNQEFIWSSKFSPQNPKINYLEKLLQNNSINNYFQEKSVQQLEPEDIFFYISNRELFQRLPIAGKKQLINNTKVDISFKFYLASQLHMLDNVNNQKSLITTFNEYLLQMKEQEVVFCLQKICQFQNSIQRLNIHAIEQRLKQCVDDSAFLRIVYSLVKLDFKVNQKIQKIIEQKLNKIDNPSIKIILYLKKISQFYKINLSQYIQKKMQNKLIDNNLQVQEGEAEDIIKLLDFYPQFANIINLQHFKVRDYIDYLDFFIINKTVIPIPHKIPYQIIGEFETHEFLQVIQKRISLQMDTPLSFVKSFKHYFSSNLNSILAIIKYLHQQEIKENQIWLEVQKTLTDKIFRHGVSIFQNHNIVDVCKILGYLSVHNYGSIPFWKKSIKIVQEAFEDGKYFKSLTGEQQKKFVVYVYQIFKNKSLSSSLQQKIIDLTLLSLMLNKWKLKQILPLTTSLTSNRLGDHELWFAIQKKIQQNNKLNHLQNEGNRKALKIIVSNFNTMSKGTFSFWHDVSLVLSKNQKNQILNQFKNQKSMAHNYFNNDSKI